MPYPNLTELELMSIYTHADGECGRCGQRLSYKDHCVNNAVLQVKQGFAKSDRSRELNLAAFGPPEFIGLCCA